VIFKTATRLDCKSNVEGRAKVIMKLQCTVCSKFHSSVLYQRNLKFRIDSIHTSNIRDHATSEQHSHAVKYSFSS